ncbi:MAG: SurA N-terminal domain-containing protein [Oculatellaceae cyanobacterium Prado106]|jgi:parvulin-like peptidyl-prolyl isomerase|nr:SurA N-terminal domain-containing protein [Oculatellaceae cyanobacterium Prado106]
MYHQSLGIDQSEQVLELKQQGDLQPCSIHDPNTALLAVNMIDFLGILLSPDEIVTFLKHQLQIRSICQQILYQRLIDHAAEDRHVKVSAQEIQAEADRTRYELRLESAARTQEWLTDNLLTPEDWEIGIRTRLLRQKLKETLFAQDVERIFMQSRIDFEQISLYRLRVPYLPLAQELFYQIEEGEISFYEAAHLYDVDEQRQLRCGYDGCLRRLDFEPDIAAILFGANTGHVLGPFPVDAAYELLMVSEFITPELTHEVREVILEQIFQEWLESEFNHFIHH